MYKNELKNEQKYAQKMLVFCIFFSCISMMFFGWISAFIGIIICMCLGRRIEQLQEEIDSY